MLIETGVAPTVMKRLALPVPTRLLALMVTLPVPVTEGVPRMRPVAGFTLKPAGRPDAL
jgi:hypothetical protein